MNDNSKLDQISDGLMSHLHQSVEAGTNDANTPLEAILKTTKGAGRRPAAPKKHVQSVVEIDGYKLTSDDLTICFFKLVRLNNPEVDKILTAANFSMFDLLGKPIYPRVVPAKEKDVSPPADSMKGAEDGFGGSDY